MFVRSQVTREDLAQLDRLRWVAATCRALEHATKEAQLERDELITNLVDEGRVSFVRIAKEAGITRAWPGKISGYHRERARRWRSEHPDRLEVLRDARKRLNRMIATAKEGESEA